MKKDINGSATMQSNDAAMNSSENLNTTISTDAKMVAGKIFSSAELWNIQRQRKSLSSRRYSF